METDNLPYISVIITAYNRREFLFNAIESALKQTLDKEYYEIIVIKNFTDINIDEFINKNKIKHIVMDGTVGEYLDKGISEAKGEIIAFLDDDDLFFENKLYIVYKKFKKDNNIAYYHNLYVAVNENGKIINNNNLNTSLDFNISSISIKKSIVKIQNARNINGATDVLMYIFALESDKKIIKGKEKLTYYMSHNSASHIVCNSIEEYRKFVINASDLYLSYYTHFNNLVHSRKAVNFLNSRRTGVIIDKYIFGADEYPDKLINYMINNPSNLKFKTAFFLSCILIKVYPGSRKYFSNKIWSIHNKWLNEAV